MKELKLSQLWIVLILLVFLAGCTQNDVVSQSDNDISKLVNKVLELEQAVEKQQEIINKFKEIESKVIEVEALNNKIKLLEEQTSDIYSTLFVTTEILNYTSTSKTVMLNHAEIQGDQLNLNITYTNKIIDEDAPNRYRLVETGEGTIVLSISKNVPIYLLENPSTLTEAKWEQIVGHRSLLQLYEKNGEVVFIKELYIA